MNKHTFEIGDEVYYVNREPNFHNASQDFPLIGSSFESIGKVTNTFYYGVDIEWYETNILQNIYHTHVRPVKNCILGEFKLYQKVFLKHQLVSIPSNTQAEIVEINPEKVCEFVIKYDAGYYNISLKELRMEVYEDFKKGETKMTKIEFHDKWIIKKPITIKQIIHTWTKGRIETFENECEEFKQLMYNMTSANKFNTKEMLSLDFILMFYTKKRFDYLEKLGFLKRKPEKTPIPKFSIKDTPGGGFDIFMNHIRIMSFVENVIHSYEIPDNLIKKCDIKCYHHMVNKND